MVIASACKQLLTVRIIKRKGVVERWGGGGRGALVALRFGDRGVGCCGRCVEV